MSADATRTEEEDAADFALPSLHQPPKKAMYKQQEKPRWRSNHQGRCTLVNQILDPEDER